VRVKEDGRSEGHLGMRWIGVASFDKISHQWLLDNVSMEKETLEKWLKAGFIERGHWHETEVGAPQGGTISPVLMNLTLDGLERVLSQNPKFKKKTRSGKRTKVNLVRFADDIIVTGSSKELLENEVKPLIEEFLKVRGLELSPEKTRIIHITEGFDFLSGQSSSFVWPRQAFADTPRSKVKPTHMTQRGKTTLSNVWM
jgi:retron-type reverse transcriptase